MSDFLDKLSLLMVLLGIAAIILAGAYLTYILHWVAFVVYVGLVLFVVGGIILTTND